MCNEFHTTALSKSSQPFSPCLVHTPSFGASRNKAECIKYRASGSSGFTVSGWYHNLPAQTLSARRARGKSSRVYACIFLILWWLYCSSSSVSIHFRQPSCTCGHLCVQHCPNEIQASVSCVWMSWNAGVESLRLFQQTCSLDSPILCCLYSYDFMVCILNMEKLWKYFIKFFQDRLKLSIASACVQLATIKTETCVWCIWRKFSSCLHCT